ncbi:MAG: TolC family protein [Rikenellaceae bacterium]
MTHKIKMILLALIFSTSVVEAQEKVLTLEECRSMALENNYNLKTSKERLFQSEDMLSAYKTNRLPNFSLSANYLYSTTDFTATITGGYLPIFTNGVMSTESFAYMPDQEFEFKVASMYNAGLMLTQPIYMGGKISNAIKLAQVGIDVSELQIRKSETDVLVLVDEAYTKVLELEELLASAKKYEAVVSEFHRQLESAYKHGMKTRNDLMKIGVRVNEAKLLTQKATNGLRLAQMNLCYVIGMPMTTKDLQLDEPAPINYYADENNLDVTSRPEYSMLLKQVEAKELELKITKSDFLPTVSAIANYGYTGGASLNGSTLFGGANFSGGVMVSVPIFHWGEGKRKSSAKQREINMAQYQLEDLTQKMQLELLQTVNTYNESVLEVQLTEESVRQAEENMRLSKNQYDKGMETIADYLESQALWQKAMSDLCTAKATQRVSYAKYKSMISE